jgi:hypothetical protein
MTGAVLIIPRPAIPISCRVMLLLARGASQTSLGVDTSAMDTSVDPCSDFCPCARGTEVKNNPIPPDGTVWGRFDELFERTLAILRGILERSAPGEDRRRLLQVRGCSSPAPRRTLWTRRRSSPQSSRTAGVRPTAPGTSRGRTPGHPAGPASGSRSENVPVAVRVRPGCRGERGMKGAGEEGGEVELGSASVACLPTAEVWRSRAGGSQNFDGAVVGTARENADL